MIATVASCDSSFSMTSDPQQRHHHRPSNSFSSVASSYSATDVESLYIDEFDRAATQQFLLRPLAILATSSPEIHLLTRQGLSHQQQHAQHHRQGSLSSQSSISTCSSHQWPAMLPTNLFVPDLPLVTNHTDAEFNGLQPRSSPTDFLDEDTDHHNRRAVLSSKRKAPTHRTLKSRVPKQSVPTHRRISFDSLPTLAEMEGDFRRACSVQSCRKGHNKDEPL